MSPAVLGEVPIQLRKGYEGFDMFGESDAFAAVSGQATQSTLESLCKSLQDEPPDPPPGVNVEAVLKAADDYNDATFKEPEGTNPERRRKVINTETGDVANARGGVNIIGDLNQDSPRIVVLPCTFPTKSEIQNGKIRFTSSGSPFVTSMSDPANATAMLVLSIISDLQTFFPNLVFVVFDVCNTVPDGGHNQVTHRSRCGSNSRRTPTNSSSS